MHKLLAAFAAAVVTLTATTSSAQECVFPLHPGPLERTQPDGARVTVFQRGDAFANWLEDGAGHPIVESAAGFVYARLGNDGALAATDVRVGSANPAQLGIPRRIVPTRTTGLARPANPRAKAGMSLVPARQGGGGAFALGAGSVKNLVILLRFSNHGPTGQNRTLPTQANFTTIMNAVGGDPTLAPTGSVRDHYLETSYGQFTIDSTVVGWIDVPNTEAYYANANSGLTTRTWELIQAGLAAADPLVDFGQFDQDQDGRIDAITFLHSGYGAEWGGTDQYGTTSTNRMWSHKWEIPTWTSAEGVKVADYNISPGLWSTSGSGPGRIGVVCHELGHFFGLPDLYDTGGIGAPSSGIGNWCLMAAGSWGFDSSQQFPSHMSAWAKVKLGWAVPTTILPGTQSLAQVESNAVIAKIDSGYPPGEYLLVENRQKVGFDLQLPQGGLAVWHCDEGKGELGQNNPNSEEGYPGQIGWPGNAKHYRVALLQADGNFDLENNSGRGDAGDVYRSGGTNQITNSSTPNTDAYQAGSSFDNNNRLTSISASAATMTFNYTNISAPTITTASLAAATTGSAYSAALASTGGTNPKTWSEYRANPTYAVASLGPQSFALGGTAQNWRSDEQVWSLSLPFAFPYWDTQYTSIRVSSNGFIDLAATGAEPYSRADWLRFALRIAPLWDDLRTDTSGRDIFVDTSVTGQVRIRWAAEHFDSATACNFAVVLFADGRIRFEYGSGNTNLTPIVGISRGESGGFHIPTSHSGQGTLTNAVALLFTLQGSQIPLGMTLTSAGVLSGTPTASGTYTPLFRVTDNVRRYDQDPFTLVVSGSDNDGDGVPNGSDNCPNVANPTQGNADGDATGDACDTCTDTDADGFGNPGFAANTCPLDGCPNDPLKSTPGACGCGVSDADSDGDGAANCIDGCPSDPSKIAPGVCGCGIPDTDSDGDGTPNCNDGCPLDPLKITPGVCGCGVPNTDSDGDGTPNCNDGCPSDPLKTAPGICGCGVPDTDSDGDGTANCNDACPNDPLKTTPGICGCGVPDTDSDGDGAYDCDNDQCPFDPLKISPGFCGCGVADTDSDGDGLPDCLDLCPTDPLKTTPGACGCGVSDVDTDGDGAFDCTDNCDSIANPTQSDCDLDGIGDPCEIAGGSSSDLDLNGVPDDCTGLILAFCPGDGSGSACPCGNVSPSSPIAGCLHSLGTGGVLAATGTPSVSADTLVLAGSAMPSSSALYFQGTAQQSAGAGVAFGDGLRCASGTILRLGTKQNSAGTSQYPVLGDLTVSVRGALPPTGGTRTYQVWYRNAAAFCTSSTFNLTNGVIVVWTP